MKIKLSLIIFATGLLLFGTSCNKYLDEIPDNRTDVDSPEKVRKLLVNAYFGGNNKTLVEFMTDNFTDNGRHLTPRYDVIERIYTFQEWTDISQDTPYSVWEGCYNAIAHANLAIQTIESFSASEQTECTGMMGEALIARAYWHFYLYLTFCQAYSSEHALTMGIPYVTEPEETAVMEYDNRGTLEELFANIAADIEKGIPLLDDTIYEHPKFHFNTAAANAFAAQFYLHYANKANYEDAERYLRNTISYANAAIGLSPTLRDMNLFDTFSTPGDINNAWESSTSTGNLLITAGTSLFGRYHTQADRFGHNQAKLQQTFRSTGPWGNNLARWDHIYRYWDRNLFFPKSMEHFVFTNIAAGIGYPQVVNTMLTKEKTLLDRAEAYVLLGEYDMATADLNRWYTNCGGQTASRAAINNFYREFTGGVSTGNRPPMNPIRSDLTTEQINFIYAVLHARRIETAHEGNRLYDIKRYGLEYTHFIDGASDIVIMPFDLRLAVQLPQMVINAGLEPNRRSDDREDQFNLSYR